MFIMSLTWSLMLTGFLLDGEGEGEREREGDHTGIKRLNIKASDLKTV